MTFAKSNLLTSGFAWEGNTERCSPRPPQWLMSPQVPAMSFYLSDPTFRNLWRGLHRLLINGILFSPTRTHGEE